MSDQVSKSSVYQAYYKAKLEGGLLYQDFVVDTAWHLLGLAIVQYSSRVYQMEIGESRTGVEIKHDEKFSKTRNLWIECAEKARPRDGPYVPSGIYRTDNTWLYCIGDYDTIFFFPKVLLRGLHQSGKWRLLENNTGTSQGFLLAEGDGEKYAAVVLRPNASNKVMRIMGNIAALGKELHHLAKANPAQGTLFPEDDKTWSTPLAKTNPEFKP
jgi:hypothetical protein